MKHDPPAEGEICFLCSGEKRVKFGETDKPIIYCLRCMIGTGAGLTVDMLIFQSCKDQYDEVYGDGLYRNPNND